MLRIYQVEKEGEIKDISIQNTLGDEIDNELLRLFCVWLNFFVVVFAFGWKSVFVCDFKKDLVPVFKESWFFILWDSFNSFKSNSFPFSIANFGNVSIGSCVEDTEELCKFSCSFIVLSSSDDNFFCFLRKRSIKFFYLC